MGLGVSLRKGAWAERSLRHPSQRLVSVIKNIAGTVTHLEWEPLGAWECRGTCKSCTCIFFF